MSVSLKAGRNMLAASLHIMGADIVRLAQNYTDRFLIGSLLGASSLGVYTVCGKRSTNQPLSFLHEPWARVGLSTLSRAAATPLSLHPSLPQPTDRRRNHLTGFVMLARRLLGSSAAAGEHWQDCVPILQALCVASCAGSVRVFNNPLLLAVGRPRSHFA